MFLTPAIDRIGSDTIRLLAQISVLLLTTVMLLVSSSCAIPAEEAPVIFTNSEELHGSWNDAGKSIAAFKGIPFAAPPVADLRWRAPVANQPRNGPQDAAGFAPACMQTTYMTDWYAAVAEAFGSGPEVAAQPIGVSEDCLYLNVWAPLPASDAGLPVMIWVHGGSNRGGWSYEPNYVGGNLAKKGVIVVSIAYRLGIFGFFSHPSLDNGENKPLTNFGILDIARAVQWVEDNIGAFGGDPNNITLVGESAGAGNISDLVTMELAAGSDISRIILQSSASDLGARRMLADDQATGQQFINSLGFESTLTTELLRSIPAGDLLTASMTVMPDHYFNAVIDNLTMKLSPLESLRRGDDKQLDVLIGTNADEWYMYIDKNASQADLEKTIKQKAPKQASAIMAEVSQLTNVRRAIDHIQTADNMLCPSRYLAARVSELGGQGWVYYFSRQRPGPGGDKLGAYHGTEIPYVFDTQDDWLPGDNIDANLTDAVMDYWVQFARSGNPNVESRPPWPVFKRQNPLVMELGDNIGAMKPNDAWLCEMLDPDQQELRRGL